MSWRKVFLTAFLAVTSLIGAGFASGQEILTFFGSFSVSAALCAGLTSMLFIFFIYLFLRGGTASGTRIEKVFKVFKVLICIIICGSMTAGLVAMEEKLLSNTYGIYSLIILFICFYLAGRSINFLKALTFALVPVIAVFIFAVLFITSRGADMGVYLPVFVKFGPAKSALYVALNLFLISGVLNEAGKELNKKESWAAAIISGSVLGICILAALLTFRFYGINETSLMPFAEISAAIGSVFYVFYYVILFISITSSLISFLFSLFHELARPNELTKFALLIIIFAISFIGFKNIVDNLYVAQGAIALIYLVYAAVCFKGSKAKQGQTGVKEIWRP